MARLVSGQVVADLMPDYGGGLVRVALGHIPPAEAEARYYAMQDTLALAALGKRYSLRQTLGGLRPL